MFGHERASQQFHRLDIADCLTIGNHDRRNMAGTQFLQGLT